MKNFTSLRLCVFALGLLLLLAASPVIAETEDDSKANIDTRPNFIVIFTDDQGYGDLGCFGGTHVKTPNVDQMAAEGSRLTNFYVSAPICTPSRASLMTGTHAQRIGMNDGVCLAGDPHGLNPDEITIAEVAKSAGYQTAMFGKWHLGDQPELLPTKQGFDIFFGLPYSHDINPRHPNKKYQFPPLPLLEGEQVVEEKPNPAHLTKRFTQRAVQYIANSDDQPFFLYLAHPMPHRPLYASEDFMQKVPQKLQDAVAEEDANLKMGRVRDKLYPFAVNEIDWSVGKILDAVKARGIDDNTFIIFTSDNGPMVGSAKPLSGKKGSILEGGMRMPTVVRWPGKILAGKDNAEIMSTMDLLPTFAKWMNATPPTDRVIDGKDISETLVNHQPSPHEFFFYIHPQKNLQAARSGKWKLRKDKKNVILNDLENDVAEKKNVAAEHPEVVSKLTKAMLDFDLDLKQNARPAASIKNAKTLTTNPTNTN